MNKSFVIQILCFALIALVLQIFIPVININGLAIYADILIIFLVYIGYYYGRFEAIIMGFSFGLIQDILTQFELIGIMAFSKSLLGYGLGTMALYHSIWHKNFRMFFIFIMYLLYFFIYNYIKFNGTMISSLLFLEIIFIQTILCFCILVIFDKSIMENGISK